MLSLISVIGTVLALALLRQIARFRGFLSAAKQSGIPFVIVPVTSYQPVWLLTHKLWMPMIRLLPRRWTSSWIEFLTPGWAWTQLHAPYKSIGSDFFLTVSPFGNILWVCDASIIHQITTRRNDFPKDVRMYRFIDVYGKNLVTTEGSDWVRHRKATAPTFSERNHQVVWREALYQTERLLEVWTRGSQKSQWTILDGLEDSMKLSLHVIAKAGFGRRMLWPLSGGSTTVEAAEKAEIGINKDVHLLSFADALSMVLDKLLWIALIPHWLLAIMPFKVTKSAHLSFMEWGKYMEELYKEAKDMNNSEASSETSEESFDLLRTLVKSVDSQVGETSQAPGRKTPESKVSLSKREVLGNAFIFMFGGHETTASTIYHALVFLAMNPDCQRLLQDSLDKQFSGRTLAEWNYETDLPQLLSGVAGAVINETLRLIPPIMQMPKTTLERGQSLNSSEKTLCVPPHTKINIVISAAHRNPNYWPPCRESLQREKIHGAPHNADDLKVDLDSFKPQRWLMTRPQPGDILDDQATATLPFCPQRGSYIPFSDGRRSCIGRRFALIEAVTVVAAIFTTYSIELVVDENSVPFEEEHLSRDAMRKRWYAAIERSRYATREGLSAISFERRKSVPLRLVTRGKEKYWDMGS